MFELLAHDFPKTSYTKHIVCLTLFSSLLYTLDASLLKKKPMLSLLCIESLSGSEEGRGGQPTMPELLN